MKERFTKRFTTLDQDQQDTLVSTGIVLAIALLMAPFLSKAIELAWILPTQFLITYFFFARQTVKRTKQWYIDTRSNKRWKRGHWISGVSVACVVVGMMLVGSMSPPGSLVVVVVLCPLLISRAFIWFYKLPLAALYTKEPQDTHAIESSTKKITYPAYSYLPYNRFHRQ